MIATPHPRQFARLTVRGAVQGVGFRPFVYRLAAELNLCGSVRNTPSGVVIEAQGALGALEALRERLETEKPAAAVIREIEWQFSPTAEPAEAFVIERSDSAGDKSALILPDLATCPACRREIFDPGNRRYRYPFTNCTHCGPRFTIIEALPYDRPNTAMRRFWMCPECAAEYHDPHDRRFHAQPNACPRCGPRLELRTGEKTALAFGELALKQAAGQLRAGWILALKGLGGFQLLVDARNSDAVERLRRRKRRPDKPLAVMYPSLEYLRREADVAPEEERLLLSSAAPIVLVRRRPGADLAAAVSPANPWLGAMLPYSPLHHLLLADLGFPVVATSGNFADEPICTDETEAVARLGGIADVFLVHDRPIVRPVDDSVARVVLGRELMLRRARGYAPLPVRLGRELPAVFAAGAHFKNAVALAKGREVFLSQHIGDLSTPQAHAAFRRAASDLSGLYAAEPKQMACDLHPDYLSTRHARESGLPVTAVQHHYAHVLAVMAEHGLDGPVLGICWDGTGYGADGAIWGGEFLRVNDTGFTRAAHLLPFPLPGGDAAAREPRRSALGAAYATKGDALFDDAEEPVLATFSPLERTTLRQALARGINSPPTSSAGRLFDAVAALAGLRQRASFEGQAAMDLEFAVDELEPAAYPFEVSGAEPLVIDWRPAWRAACIDAVGGESAGRIAARFHRMLVDAIALVAGRLAVKRVVLTGGCFQNAWLLTQAVTRLRADGFIPDWPRWVPPNDGGIALGQIVAAARQLARRPEEFSHHVPGHTR